MANTVVGIRFKTAGKKYYFDPKDHTITRGDKVVVETIRGFELGEVIEDIKTVEDKEIISALKPVLRVETEEDLANFQANQESIPNDLIIIADAIRKNKLDMKLLGAEYTLDKSKLIIYFNADGRVDFRELVKDLANAFRLRIELRQVGTRDGAKFLGGIGPCGYLLCCNTFLGDFETVSIRMAKNQNLSLNPANISGLCGKLLCCIKYENDTYTEHRQELPKVGSFVKTEDAGRCRVIAVNIIDKSVRVLTEEEGIKSYQVEDLKHIEQYDKPKPKRMANNMPEVINDLLGYDGIKIIQRPDMFNFSLDSTLLADFVTPLTKTKHIIDLGTGNAPIPLFLSLKTTAQIVGVEIQDEVYDLAKRSVELNNLQDQITIVHKDINNIHKEYENGAFDIVTCNPPFFKYKASSNINKSDYKTIARHEVLITLEQIIKESKRLLRTKGSLYMVHRTERLIDIINALQAQQFSIKRMRFVYPKQGQSSNMVLIEASNNGNTSLSLMEPLYVHDNDNYTEEIIRIFRYGKE